MADLQNNGVLSFGEVLLRICPDTDGAWLKENQLTHHVGGAEGNVASALAQWGLPSFYMTAMPPNFMSEQIVQYLERRLVDMSRTIYSVGRLGLFFLPKGQDMKHAEVIYDREHSSFARLLPETIDWDAALQGIGWLHLSAISPALTANTAALCLEAVKAAAERGVRISLDLNYRSKLWKYGEEPIEVIPHIAQYCDLIMGNIWAAEVMLGISFDHERLADADQATFTQLAEASSAEVMKRFPKCAAVANTFRFTYQQSGIEYYTTLYQKGVLTVSTRYLADQIVDKVGSGDCFMAGLIYGSIKGFDEKDTIEFATAAAYSKLFVAGDATTKSVADIEHLLNNERQESYTK